MPCIDDRPGESEERAQEATRAACELAKKFREIGGQTNTLTIETQRWIQEHDKLDAARFARELQDKIDQRLKKAALDKLTDAEKKLLGIRG